MREANGEPYNTDFAIASQTLTLALSHDGRGDRMTAGEKLRVPTR